GQQAVSLSSYQGSGVSITGITVTGPNATDYSIVSNCPTQLIGYCEVDVTFTPSVSGLRIAQLNIQDNAAGNPQIIPLAGLGTKPPPASPVISFLPIPLTFSQAEGIGYTATSYMSITNTGTANALLSSFQLSGRNSSDFGL